MRNQNVTDGNDGWMGGRGRIPRGAGQLGEPDAPASRMPRGASGSAGRCFGDGAAGGARIRSARTGAGTKPGHLLL